MLINRLKRSVKIKRTLKRTLKRLCSPIITNDDIKYHYDKYFSDVHRRSFTKLKLYDENKNENDKIKMNLVRSEMNGASYLTSERIVPGAELFSLFDDANTWISLSNSKQKTDYHVGDLYFNKIQVSNVDGCITIEKIKLKSFVLLSDNVETHPIILLSQLYSLFDNINTWISLYDFHTSRNSTNGEVYFRKIEVYD